MEDNLIHYCACPMPVLTEADKKIAQHRKAAILNGVKWDLGATISIRFIDGSADLRKRVEDVAMQWTKIANLDFDFRNAGPTDIRIAFTPGNGSWSYLGTVCRQFKDPTPTMNFGWLTDASDQLEVQRVVLHEFGHAIGLIHEHQNPKGGIKWNKDAVRHDLSRPPNSWDDATIENNMFKYYAPSSLTATDVDPKSIMMYPIPKAWTTDGMSAGLNSALTATDKALVSSVYPGRLQV